MQHADLHGARSSAARGVRGSLGAVSRGMRKLRKLVRVVRVPAYRRALLRGVGAAIEHDGGWLPSHVLTVIDVGANRGQFALVAVRRWPDARLICLEPLPDASRVLRRALGRRPVTVVDAAASDHTGVAGFHLSRARDSSSLREIGPAQTQLFSGTDEVGVVTVDTVRLDDIVDIPTGERPALLKIDVQGAEIEVLHGAERLLRVVDFVLVESSLRELYVGQDLAGAVIAFLSTRGFVLSAITSPTVDAEGALIQADFLFQRGAENPAAVPNGLAIHPIQS